jgi:Flp pilus assembly protein TadG
MTKSRNPSGRNRARQRGAAAVEFGLVAALFLMLVIGIMEMGRVLFYWNAAGEATRLGARMAVVCDLNDTEIKARMQNMLTILPPEQIDIEYAPAGCNASSCTSITVRVLNEVAIATFIPFVPLSLTLPPFSTTLPRESMRSTVDGMPNPVCG